MAVEFRRDLGDRRGVRGGVRGGGGGADGAPGVGAGAGSGPGAGAAGLEGVVDVGGVVGVVRGHVDGGFGVLAGPGAAGSFDAEVWGVLVCDIGKMG